LSYDIEEGTNQLFDKFKRRTNKPFDTGVVAKQISQKDALT
jgi:hypothetical protein